MWNNSQARGLRKRSARQRHNPLLRRSDRIENMLTLAVVVLAFAMLPLAILVGARTIDSQLTLAEKQVADYRTVSATTLADSTGVSVTSDVAPSGVDTAPAKWTWGNETRHADITVDPATPSGTKEDIWVNADGNLTTEPMSPSAARVAGVIAGLFTWFAVMMIALSGFLICRASLNRARDAQWDRDLRQFLDSTTRH
ncbi:MULTISPECIES: hypothetical protein [Rhodococcus]|jgi:hypothetical protein|uniref:Transmembrane protein n=3 Tax=Rhodococcus TaxID=1827 RepID=X0PM50_RHOWR|nr:MULTISPECIES: hypothetical protein [Rhodococcus]AII07079.1 hypothetical protein EP51_21455 [Rhodococcus opacus]EJI96946.1 hypothetical protein JVH1_5265 [Rhodococcus sp. JVH1]MDI9954655.1 hypothetical protein [Rhodococcus sp. IEGM 1305]REE74495.1 hypothetical protein C8E05_3931 [Rhodococcus wratislaviensis]SPZ41968.1 Probable membrane protein Rv1733c/MT1774 [Rhodococcus wratislaviensis]